MLKPLASWETLLGSTFVVILETPHNGQRIDWDRFQLPDACAYVDKESCAGSCTFKSLEFQKRQAMCTAEVDASAEIMERVLKRTCAIPASKGPCSILSNSLNLVD